MEKEDFFINLVSFMKENLKMEKLTVMENFIFQMGTFFTRDNEKKKNSMARVFYITISLW